MGSLIGSTFLDQFALQTNGSTQYAYRDNPSFSGDTQGAFVLWYRPTTVLAVNGAKRILGFGRNNAGNDSTFAVEQRHNNSVNIAPTWRNQPIPSVVHRATNGGTSNSVYGEHIFAATTWVHMVIQSNGSAWQIWINGTNVTGAFWVTGGANNGAWLGNLSGTDRRLTLGAGWQANALMAPSDQRSNELLYVNRPLTSGEIIALYNGGVPRNPHRIPSLWPDCKLWLRCGDSRDNSTTMFDESGNGNDFTLVASPSYVAS
jgi:hypothetical protein